MSGAQETHEQRNLADGERRGSAGGLTGSPFGGLVLLLTHLRIFILLPLLTFVVFATVALLSPRTYRSAASFVPYAQAQGGAAAGLAAQLGISLPGGGSSHSPEFYAEFLETREVLARVAETEYSVTMPARSGLGWSWSVRTGTLADLLELDEEDQGRRADLVLRSLRDMVSVSVGRLSGTVSIGVSSPSPYLSEQIVQRMLALVDELNLRQRQERASLERAFIREQLEVARDELREAEDRLEKFLLSNRSFETSPELRFEHDRLQRMVGMRQQLYTSLAQAFDQARIEEVRNTPSITLVQSPFLPGLPERRYLIVKGIVALVVGFGLALVTVFGKELWASARVSEPRTMSRLESLWRQVLNDLHRPWRLLRAKGG